MGFKGLRRIDIYATSPRQLQEIIKEYTYIYSLSIDERRNGLNSVVW